MVSLVTGSGKWNKKTNDLREMDKGIAQRSDGGQRKNVFASGGIHLTSVRRL